MKSRNPLPDERLPTADRPGSGSGAGENLSVADQNLYMYGRVVPTADFSATLCREGKRKRDGAGRVDGFQVDTQHAAVFTRSRHGRMNLTRANPKAIRVRGRSRLQDHPKRGSSVADGFPAAEIRGRWNDRKATYVERLSCRPTFSAGENESRIRLRQPECRSMRQRSVPRASTRDSAASRVNGRLCATAIFDR